MTRRRALLVAIVAASAVAAVIAVGVYRSNSHRAPAGCDTVRAMLTYNSEFRDQTKDSAAAGGPGPATEDQYRQWAAGMKNYAAQITNPDLSGRANSAAGLAGRLADLVPRYRARPDDPATAREYAGIGIEFGNAITMLEYLCLR